MKSGSAWTMVLLPLIGTTLIAQVCSQILGLDSFPRGPYLGPDFADPSILHANDTWYAFSSQHNAYPRFHVPMAISSDFISWEHLVDGNGYEMDAMPELPPWVNHAAPNTWAPDVAHWHDGTYTLLFSAALAIDAARHCIGIATSVVPMGPYVSYLDTPLICPLAQGGAVDAAHFHDTLTDRHYVVYKVDGNSLSNLASHPGTCTNGVPPIQPTPLVLQEIDPQALILIGEPMVLLDNDGEALGDHGRIMAPSLIRAADGFYVLFFTAGCYLDGTFHVEYASRTDLGGLFERHGTLLETGTPLAGDMLQSPGSLSVDADNEHAVFHAGLFDGSGSYRQMWTVNMEEMMGLVNFTAA